MTVIGGLVELLPYIVAWNEDLEEYVATTPAYPLFAYEAPTEKDALNGLKALIADIDLNDDDEEY